MVLTYQGKRCSRPSTSCGVLPPKLFDADEIDIALSEEGIAVDPRTLRAAWEAEVFAGINEATLNVPQEQAYRTGGKKGLHTEHLGPMLAEMQYLQRVLPGQQW